MSFVNILISVNNYAIPSNGEKYEGCDDIRFDIDRWENDGGRSNN